MLYLAYLISSEKQEIAGCLLLFIISKRLEKQFFNFTFIIYYLIGRIWEEYFLIKESKKIYIKKIEKLEQAKRM